ncbi:MAG: aminotransferase class III-fold pyridoxal phosphate-dependent enzyme [Rhodobacteraceae bacterium]|nr:aminotransferase class III-fold pyridoxal phosphate-dependent enzyme [Paracoccaceae bacterium]
MTNSRTNMAEGGSGTLSPQAGQNGTAGLVARRRLLLGPNVPTFYQSPIHIVRGKGVWLWDNDGRRYLDCYNNVPHVGHCHPRVVEAISMQCATLNTHTRYLHSGILEYLESVLPTFDDQLGCGLLTCSGSEANDVALRMAQSFTGHSGFIATDSTYHGNTALVSQLDRRGGPVGGLEAHVVRVPCPVGESTRYKKTVSRESRSFAASVAVAVSQLEERRQGCAALILCPFFANEGFPTLPKGFLDQTVEIVQAAGGVVICDEVQPGFGRLGSHFWGHERIGIVPDIVTLGKPMGNGHPVAGVIARPDVLGAFRQDYKYFNTFAGNPVAVAAAQATLDCIREDGLIENARTVGSHARRKLQELAEIWDCLGVVRGSGMYFGVEVCDSDGLPAGRMAGRIVNAMRDLGVLIGTAGRYGSILKIRPPLPISVAEIDILAETLHRALKGTK